MVQREHKALKSKDLFNLRAHSITRAANRRTYFNPLMKSLMLNRKRKPRNLNRS